MLCRSIPSPVLLQLQEGAQGSAGSMGQAEEEMHPWHPKPNEMGPGVPLWAGGVISRGWVPWQGAGLQAWAAVSVAHGCSGYSSYNTGLVSGRRRVDAAPPGHPMRWGSCQNAAALCREHPWWEACAPGGTSRAMKPCPSLEGDLTQSTSTPSTPLLRIGDQATPLVIPVFLGWSEIEPESSPDRLCQG